MKLILEKLEYSEGDLRAENLRLDMFDLSYSASELLVVFLEDGEVHVLHGEDARGIEGSQASQGLREF